MISVVLGRRGCGKTTLIKGVIASRPRLLVFDTLAEYGRSGKVFRSIPPLIDYVEANAYGQFRAVYQPVETQDLETDFSDFMRLAWIAGANTIVVDEIDQVSSPSSVPDQLARNLRYGRHRKMFVIAASRRAADVPRLITSQADELYTFNQTEPRDIQYIAEFAGKDFAQRTLSLPLYKALVYRPFDGTISERMSDSPKEKILTLRGSSPNNSSEESPIPKTPPTEPEHDEDPQPADDTTEDDEQTA